QDHDRGDAVEDAGDRVPRGAERGVVGIQPEPRQADVDDAWQSFTSPFDGDGYRKAPCCGLADPGMDSELADPAKILVAHPDQLVSDSEVSPARPGRGNVCHDGVLRGIA